MLHLGSRLTPCSARGVWQQTGRIKHESSLNYRVSLEHTITSLDGGVVGGGVHFNDISSLEIKDCKGWMYRTILWFLKNWTISVILLKFRYKHSAWGTSKNFHCWREERFTFRYLKPKCISHVLQGGNNRPIIFHTATRAWTSGNRHYRHLSVAH